MGNSDLALRLFLNGSPKLDKDVQIDACPNLDGARAMRTRYAAILKGHGLADRYGVFTRPLYGERGGFGIYVGPHEESVATT